MSKILCCFLFFTFPFLLSAKESKHDRKERVREEQIPNGNNAYLVDQDQKFKLIRTAEPNEKEFIELCSRGVQRMIVMDGSGEVEEGYIQKYKEEPWFKKNCPDFKVIYNCQQKTAVPLSKQFLTYFDEEVRRAKQGGYGLAFRCHSGTHRTGRLAEYYRAKYQGLVNDHDDIKNQRQHASNWKTRLWHHPAMNNEIAALIDYVKNEPCDVKKKQYCVSEEKDSTSSCKIDPYEKQLKEEPLIVPTKVDPVPLPKDDSKADGSSQA